MTVLDQGLCSVNTKFSNRAKDPDKAHSAALETSTYYSGQLQQAKNKIHRCVWRAMVTAMTTPAFAGSSKARKEVQG